MLPRDRHPSRIESILGSAANFQTIPGTTLVSFPPYASHASLIDGGSDLHGTIRRS